jgi:hypothetical protein
MLKVQAELTLTVNRTNKLPDGKYRGKILINNVSIGFFHYDNYTVNPDDTVTYFDNGISVITLDCHNFN